MLRIVVAALFTISLTTVGFAERPRSEQNGAGPAINRSANDAAEAPAFPFSITSQLLDVYASADEKDAAPRHYPDAKSEGDNPVPGDQKRVHRGRLVIIGPDGEKHEVEWPQGAVPLPPWKGKGFFFVQEGGDGPTAKTPELRERMMIGVTLQPVPPAVAAHLKLDEGSGVMVSSVQDDSPATKAGLARYDVITHADGEKVAGPEDLEGFIQKSEGKPVALTVIHAGEKKEISVVAEKRKVPELMFFDIHDGQGGPMFWNGANKMWFTGPGVRIPAAPDAMPFAMPPKAVQQETESLQKQLDEIRQQLKELREMIKHQRPSSPQGPSRDGTSN